ncbi:response regulator transcription factor [Cohnella nanjingensis]|uniref:Response regulator transcription factor n=1 Tax=Cohnella nanjingensis TaxID=1387779 RepID=A0A7X0RS97_9BACL|nr:response regulator transcription factor [Cohnella nanjingensis]MBB6672553.1 response regulator transcription factor [Cohnella nanjingensis]
MRRYFIFIVEDDEKIAAELNKYLMKYGYDPYIARRMDDLKREFLERKPDLVLLDINLPYYDGYYWCRQIRTVSSVPILFVSARTHEMDQVMAIEYGGDDYIAKPFNLEVMLAKVKSSLRRAYGEYAVAPQTREMLDIGGLLLDRTRNRLVWKDLQTDLTRNECILIDALGSRAGEIVSREDLLSKLWDDVNFVDDNTLSVNMTRLRKKLEQLGILNAIETVRSQGYRLNADRDAERSEASRP